MQPFAGTPAPTGKREESDVTRSLWERVCPRRGAQRPHLKPNAPIWHTFCNHLCKLRYGALHKNNEKVSLMDNATSLPAGASTAPATEKTTASRLKSIFSGSIGNMVEWYDWYVYAAFSLYFAKAFFPAGDSTAQLLNTAAIFAVGFLMRPIGGWLMGLYADRKGRKAALMASVLLMCAGSLVIALTPGYETIGVAAPILLVIASLMQGLSVGGEYGT